MTVPPVPPANENTEPTPEARLQRGLTLAFAQLNRRERTVGEVRLHLERKGISAADIEAVLAALGQDGYLDDGRYALMFVHDKRGLQGWGSERIRQDLARRGVDRALIEAALVQDEVERAPGESELDRALALLRRRFPAPPRERRDRDRALGMLIRKGFEGDLALDALMAYAHDT